MQCFLEVGKIRASRGRIMNHSLAINYDIEGTLKPTPVMLPNCLSPSAWCVQEDMTPVPANKPPIPKHNAGDMAETPAQIRAGISAQLIRM